MTASTDVLDCASYLCLPPHSHGRCGYSRAVGRTIPPRELRNNSSAVLRDVQAGETIEVTNHGTVVALLVPPEAGRTSALRVVVATRSGGFATLTRVHLGRPVQEVLVDLHGER